MLCSCFFVWTYWSMGVLSAMLLWHLVNCGDADVATGKMLVEMFNSLG